MEVPPLLMITVRLLIRSSVSRNRDVAGNFSFSQNGGACQCGTRPPLPGSAANEICRVACIAGADISRVLGVRAKRPCEGADRGGVGCVGGDDLFGSIPCSTQVSSAVKTSLEAGPEPLFDVTLPKELSPGPPPQWPIPGAMNKR